MTTKTKNFDSLHDAYVYWDLEPADVASLGRCEYVEVLISRACDGDYSGHIIAMGRKCHELHERDPWSYAIGYTNHPEDFVLGEFVKDVTNL